MNKKLKTILAAGFLVASMASQACVLTAWDSSTGAAVGGPGDANVIPRYKGLCSMDGKNGVVLNTGNNASGGPSADGHMISRFYFLAVGASDDITIFETYSDLAATVPVYTVTYNDGTKLVSVTPAGGTAVTFNASSTISWHSVEIEWLENTAGTGIKLWVDTDSLDRTVLPAVPLNNENASGTSPAGTISAVKMGGLAGASNYAFVLFDDYESRRSTLIGRFAVGDANNNGFVSVSDYVAILNELGGSFSAGTPDCTEDGIISIGDTVCVLNKL